MIDQIERAFDEFADAAEAQLVRMREEITALRALIEEMRAVQPATLEVTAADPIPGPAGEPGPQGERGADGATIEDLTAVMDARFAEIHVRNLADVYRDVFAEGTEYQRGDLVTHNGSLWLALADSTDQPGAAPDSWRMVAKEGRPGRDRR